MEYKRFFEKLKITKPDDCFLNVYKKAVEEYNENCVFFLNEEFLEKGLFDTDAHLGKEAITDRLVNIAKDMKNKYQIE